MCQEKYVPYVNAISSRAPWRELGIEGVFFSYCLKHQRRTQDSADPGWSNVRESVHNLMDMKKPKETSEDRKIEALRREGALHPRPEAVLDEAFRREEFLDPRDRVQVKYEMLRRHRLEGKPVTESAAAFGVSRQAFYSAQSAFEREGLPGLVPARRGPRRAHKCTDEVLDFAEGWRPDRPGQTLAEAVRDRFGVTVHPRSIRRALERRKKKRERRERR